MYSQIHCLANGLRLPLLQFTRAILKESGRIVQEERIAGKIEERLKRFGHHRFFRDEVGNIIWTVTRSDQGPTILLVSHMDIDQPSGNTLKTGDPFSGRIGSGRIHGIGASCSKGGLAAQIFTGHILSKSHLPRMGNLVVAAAAAETKGCGLGIRHLLETTLPRVGMKPTIAILGEPTRLGLYHGSDGWADLNLCITGKKPREVRELADRIYRELGFGNRDNGLNDDGSLQIFRSGFCVQDGQSESVFRLSYRLYPGQAAGRRFSQITRRLKEMSREDSSVAVEVHVSGERERIYSGGGMNVLQLARESLRTAGLKKVTVKTWPMESFGIGTAGNLLVNAYHIPALGFGPGDERGIPLFDASDHIKEIMDAAYGTAVICCALLNSCPDHSVRTTATGAPAE